VRVAVCSCLHALAGGAASLSNNVHQMRPAFKASCDSGGCGIDIETAVLLRWGTFGLLEMECKRRAVH
jgi:hypothetical protein